MSNDQPVSMPRRLGFVGFGEAGATLGADLAAAGLEVSCYDILFDDPVTRPLLVARADRSGVACRESLRRLIEVSDLVISAVTASAAQQVASDSAAYLQRRHWFMDINSVSPTVKRANAARVEASGAAYIEAAVMAAIPPQRLRTPLLLGGPKAGELAQILSSYGMQATAIAVEIGTASAIKMCRSVMIKGIEALTVECLFAARHFGAEQAVLASLDKTFPGMGWLGAQPDYFVSRIAEHGRRRAAEMREVADTLRDAGIEPLMATATAERQQAVVDRMKKLGLRYSELEPFSWGALADRLG